MTSLDAGLPSFTFSTDDLPSGERFDAWRDVISPILDLEPLDQLAPRACKVDVAVIHLGELLVSRIRLAGTGQRGVRAGVVALDLPQARQKNLRARGCNRRPVARQVDGGRQLRGGGPKVAQLDQDIGVPDVQCARRWQVLPALGGNPGQRLLGSGARLAKPPLQNP